MLMVMLIVDIEALSLFPLPLLPGFLFMANDTCNPPGPIRSCQVIHPSHQALAKQKSCKLDLIPFLSFLSKPSPNIMQSSSSSSLQLLLSFPPNHKLPPTFNGVSPSLNRVTRRSSRSSKSQVAVNAVEKKKSSEQYEIDPDQAKQALQKLDQQLQELSTKQVSPPRVKASEVRVTREQVKQEFREIPSSVVPYAVVALFAFTIFYNVLFLAVIKPAIDGPELTPGATVRVEMEPSRYRVMQLLQPLMPDGLL